MLSLLFACASEPVLRLQADPERTGLSGEDGPYGALEIRDRVAARVTDVVNLSLVVPADSDGNPMAGPWPVVVLVQGGLVEADRYLWMADHWASRGYATVVPDFPMELAFFNPDNAVAALTELRQHPPEETPEFSTVTPAAVTGHSLGGVVAARVWLNEPELFSALGLWASYPAGGDDVSEEKERTVLSLVGSEDGKASVADVRAGVERFGGAHTLGIIDGMNHYGWCDEATEKELAGDGVATREVAEARQDAQGIIDVYLDATLQKDSTAETTLEAGEFSGITVER